MTDLRTDLEALADTLARLECERAHAWKKANALGAEAHPSSAYVLGQEDTYGLAWRMVNDLLAKHPAPTATDCTGAADCRSGAHEHGCFADIDGTACDDPSDHPATDEEAGQ